MTDNILNVPNPTKEPGQRSLSVQDAYFTRFIPSWTFPSGLSSEAWRLWARRQPIASDCKDILVSSILSLDWKISPRESDMRDELKGSVRHYTKLLERGGEWMGLDWTGLLEWLLNDLQDLPFGAAVEVGRKNDTPEGRVMWIKPLDGGTLYPTLNKDYPVTQWYASAVTAINFPKHAIARMYMNPRPELEREGWGMAPPERVYLALEMLSRGDSYYANLLLDVPPAGILDLGDMEKESAIEWITSFKTFVANGGVDGFKVPVLYEHTNKTEFIPFGKVPNDIMYDKITLKYAALVCAAYGMTLNDIGLQASSGGETLAGGIRSEKKTRKTGLARAKKKLKYFFETILPDTLMFEFVDMDDELATALGRARLANATAWGQLIDKGIFSRDEARLQTIQDGLVSISVPEEPPTEDDWAKQKMEQAQQLKFGGPADKSGKSPERPGMLGNPQPPSQGGDGEVKKSTFSFVQSRLDRLIEKVVQLSTPLLREALAVVREDELEPMKSAIVSTVFSQEDELGFKSIIDTVAKNEPVGTFNFRDLIPDIEEMFKNEGLYPVGIEQRVADMQRDCNAEFPSFVGKAVFYTLANSNLYSDTVEEDVREKVNKSFPEYLYSFIQMSIERMLDEARNGMMEIPSEFRFKSIPRAEDHSVNVNPQITLPGISVTVPERSVSVTNPDIHVSPPNVNIQIPDNAPVINMSIPEQPAPQVTVNVPETNVTVDSPVVNVSVPAQEPSRIVIENQVNPTPVEVKNEVTVQPADVKVPKAKREVQTVHRDINLNIDSTVTDIEYEE